MRTKKTKRTKKVDDVTAQAAHRYRLAQAACLLRLIRERGFDPTSPEEVARLADELQIPRPITPTEADHAAVARDLRQKRRIGHQ